MHMLTKNPNKILYIGHITTTFWTQDQSSKFITVTERAVVESFSEERSLVRRLHSAVRLVERGSDPVRDVGRTTTLPGRHTHRDPDQGW